MTLSPDPTEGASPGGAPPSLFEAGSRNRPSGRPPNGKRRRPATTSPSGRAEHAAVYRLYAAAGRLLYVGQSNNPLERYVEHRDTKPWWPDVDTHSIEWLETREDAERREEFAIRDEWPIHNIAHQPRANGFKIPSYVGDRLIEEIRKSAAEAFPGATIAQIDGLLLRVVHAFGFGDDGDGIELGISTAPRPEPLGLESTIAAVGRFRPPIENSTRDAQPRYRAKARIERSEAG